MSEIKKSSITGAELAEVFKIFPPQTPVKGVIDWLNDRGPMPQLSPAGKATLGGLKDCLDLGRDRIEGDPKGQVVWVKGEDHAYFIPSNAQTSDQALGLVQEVNIAGKQFKVQPWTVGQLKEMVQREEALDLTKILKPQKG